MVSKTSDHHATKHGGGRSNDQAKGWVGGVYRSVTCLTCLLEGHTPGATTYTQCYELVCSGDKRTTVSLLSLRPASVQRRELVSIYVSLGPLLFVCLSSATPQRLFFWLGGTIVERSVKLFFRREEEGRR